VISAAHDRRGVGRVLELATLAEREAVRQIAADKPLGQQQRDDD